MSNPLPPITLSPAALGALQARGIAPQQQTLTPVAQTLGTKPVAARTDSRPRRGQYLDIVV